MRDTDSNSSDNNHIEDNSEEIGWVSYGMMATGTMVAYQFFLVYFMSTPSTILVKISVSLAIGLLAVICESCLKLLSSLRSCFCKRNPRHRSSSLDSETREMNEIYIREESHSEEDNLIRKNSLWKYVSSFITKIK
uniref:Uncharacterized protein n=1 Tax=Euplotes crassus TaxID=5936 RepID=A0A7S3NWW5_EUPCR|mmetsp:Transcript_39226/g.38815  ORF Transcript_39226/g.38815 Transcript_39226/m.38815 type:complete len:136 (+) Transcript_39226:1-408(+)